MAEKGNVNTEEVKKQKEKMTTENSERKWMKKKKGNVNHKKEKQNTSWEIKIRWTQIRMKS